MTHSCSSSFYILCFPSHCFILTHSKPASYLDSWTTSRPAMSCPVLLPVPPLQVEDEGLPSPWLMDSSELCEDHGDSLSLFCLDDLEPLCQQCAAERHAGHRVYLLNEAAADCKVRVTSQTVRYESQVIPAEAKLTEEQMGREFELLHQFLREEEAARLRSLREEQEEKKRDADERRDTMTQLIKSVEEKIHLTEEELHAEGDGVEYLQVTSLMYNHYVHIHLCNNRNSSLQNYQDDVMNRLGVPTGVHTSNRSVLTPGKPAALCVGENERHRRIQSVNVPLHVHILFLSLFTSCFTPSHPLLPAPVTFDPRAAGHSPRVSPRFNRVTPGPSQGPGGGLSVSDKPECFHPYSCTLSREGFDSGEHCWDIEVGDTSRWIVGVAAESVSRGTESEVCPEAGLWCISLRDNEYRALTSPSQDLNLNDTVQLSRVHVRLDWDEGTLEFKNAETDTRLFMFRHRFTEKVYPYFESLSMLGGFAALAQRVQVMVGSDHVPVEDTEGNQEIRSESYPDRRYNRVSLTYNNTKPECRRQDGDKHSVVCSVREEKKTKAQGKGKQVKTKEVKRSDVKSSTPRFRVTYHVSLNKALQILDRESQPDPEES
ncbi:E3 ubiquitin-protein ligase TRIM62-like [Tautogolabrus adspersus]